MLSSWKRSVTSLCTQYAQLYAGSVIFSAMSVYTAFLQYIVPACMLGMAVLLMWGVPAMPLGAMIVVSLSITLMRPTTLNTALYVRLYDVYHAVWRASSRVGLCAAPAYDNLRGQFLDHCALLLMLQLTVWGIWNIAVSASWYVPHMTWTSCVSIIAWIPLTAFFILDAEKTLYGIVSSSLRSVRMIWYNLPVCCIIMLAAYVWVLLIGYVPGAYILELVTVPFWLSVWYTIYVKSVHEQFSRYYPDMYACGKDAA